MQAISRFAALGLAAALMTVSVLASAGDAANTPAANAPPPGSLEAVIANNPISAIMKGPRLWTTPADPKPWVKETRSADPLAYMPVGVTPPRRVLQVKSAAELTAAKANFEATSAAMADLAAHKPVLGAAAVPPPAPAVPVAAKPARLPARVSLNKPPLASGSFSAAPIQ